MVFISKEKIINLLFMFAFLQWTILLNFEINFMSSSFLIFLILFCFHCHLNKRMVIVLHLKNIFLVLAFLLRTILYNNHQSIDDSQMEENNQNLVFIE